MISQTIIVLVASFLIMRQAFIADASAKVKYVDDNRSSGPVDVEEEMRRSREIAKKYKEAKTEEEEAEMMAQLYQSAWRLREAKNPELRSRRKEAEL